MCTLGVVCYGLLLAVHAVSGSATPRETVFLAVDPVSHSASAPIVHGNNSLPPCFTTQLEQFSGITRNWKHQETRVTRSHHPKAVVPTSHRAGWSVVVPPVEKHPANPLMVEDQVWEVSSWPLKAVQIDRSVF